MKTPEAIIRDDFNEIWKTAKEIAPHRAWSFEAVVADVIDARLRLYRQAGLLPAKAPSPDAPPPGESP